jgi:hypothetical protein
VLNKPVTIREGQRTRKVPQIEALGHRLMSCALSGDQKAVMSILALLRFAGTGSEPEHAHDGLTEQDDRAIIADYLRRVATGAADPSAETDLPSAVPGSANGTRKPGQGGGKS